MAATARRAPHALPPFSIGTILTRRAVAVSLGGLPGGCPREPASVQGSGVRSRWSAATANVRTLAGAFDRSCRAPARHRRQYVLAVAVLLGRVDTGQWTEHPAVLRHVSAWRWQATAVVAVIVVQHRRRARPTVASHVAGALSAGLCFGADLALFFSGMSG